MDCSCASSSKIFSFPDLNKAIHAKLREFSEKPFQKKEGSRWSMFLEVDKPALNSLPSAPYTLATWKIATVSFNYHIEVDRMYYSVPYTFIQKKVDVRMTTFLIEAYANNVRICSHQRLRGKAGSYSTNPEHMPPNHREYTTWDGNRFLAWACKVGDCTRELVQQILTSKKVEQQGYKSCFGILKLADRYTAYRLENACKKALELRSPSYTTVNNILKSGMDKVQAEVNSNATASNIIPIHSAIRGAQYYAQGGKGK
jgi:hypothetical protein